MDTYIHIYMCVCGMWMHIYIYMASWLLGDSRDRWRIPAAVVVRRGGGQALLRAQLLVKLLDELLGFQVHLATGRVVVPERERRVGDPELPRVRGRASKARPHRRRRRRDQREGRRLLLLLVRAGVAAAVVVVEDLEDPGNVGRVVVVPAGLGAVRAAVGAAAAAAVVVAAAALAGGDEVEVEGRVGRGVAAAELHLARVVDGEGRVECAAAAAGRRELLLRRHRRRRLSLAVVVAVVPVGGHEVAEGLAGDLAAVDEEVQVHGQLPLRHALAEHEQHGAHHVPQATRHVRLHRHLSFDLLDDQFCCCLRLLDRP